MKSILLALAVLGAPPSVDIPAEVRPAGQYVTLEPKTDAKAITYIGLSGVEPIPSAVLRDPRMFLLDVRGLAVGRYSFVAVASLNDEHKRVDFVVVIGQPPPPIVVTPPGPGPVNPPAPSPGIPLTGMRVLILEETAPLHPLSNEQANALKSLKVRAYLDAKTNKLWRKLDPDVPVSNLPKEWQDIRAKSFPTSNPWVVIAGVSGSGELTVVHQGPYPTTDADALALFQKWGG